jgi:hypothetical protein
MVYNPMIRLSRFSFLLGALLLLAPDVFAQGTGMRPGVTRPVTSGTTDTATAADYLGWIAWKSATSGAKTETLPACAASNNGMWIGISDEQNTAAANNITVSAASGTVAGQSGYIITSNLGGVIVACDGANTNWNLFAQFTPGANVRAVTTTSDTILTTDNGGLITYNNASAVAVTLPQAGTGAFPSNSFMFLVRNYGAGTVTITPTTSTISNGGSTLAITQNQGAIIYADGSGNYQDLIIGAGAGGAVSSVTGTSGQVTCTPTTGAVVCSLPSTISANLTFSGANSETGTNTFSAQVVTVPVALSGTTVAVNAALGNVFTLTLTGATTISNPTNLVAGQTMTFVITQAAGGGDTVTWSSNYKWPAGTAPTMTSTASAVDMQTCIATSSSVCLFGPAAQNVH